MEEMVAAFDNPGAHLAAYGSPSGRADASVAGTMMGEAPNIASQSQNGLRVPTGLNPRVPTGEGPRPTTLSGTSGEVAGDAPRGKSKAPIFAVLGVLVAAAGGGVLFMKQKSDDKAAEGLRIAAAERAALEKANKPPEMVKINFSSEPNGAKVFRAGITESIGTTPFQLSIKRDDADFDVLLKLDGHKSETRTVTTQRDHDVLVPLTKVEQPKVVTAPPPPVVVERTSKVKKGVGTPSKSKGGKGGDRDDVMTPNF